MEALLQTENRPTGTTQCRTAPGSVPGEAKVE